MIIWVVVCNAKERIIFIVNRIDLSHCKNAKIASSGKGGRALHPVSAIEIKQIESVSGTVSGGWPTVVKDLSEVFPIATFVLPRGNFPGGCFQSGCITGIEPDQRRKFTWIERGKSNGYACIKIRITRIKVPQLEPIRLVLGNTQGTGFRNRGGCEVLGVGVGGIRAVGLFEEIGHSIPIQIRIQVILDTIPVQVLADIGD